MIPGEQDNDDSDAVPLDENEKLVYDAIYNCFISRVTADGDEFVSPTGVRFKYVEPKVYLLDKLTLADSENGVVWKGGGQVEFLYHDGTEWKEGFSVSGAYRVKEDGQIEQEDRRSNSYSPFGCNRITNMDHLAYGFD